MRSYTCSHRRYLSFCSQFRISQPYPTSESILCQFIGYLGRQHLKYQTIKCYLSGIRYFQIQQSYQDPSLHNLPRLHYVLCGIKSEQAKENRQSRQRLPVTPSILLQIRQLLLLNPTAFNNIMLWAAFLVCFFGFLRRGRSLFPMHPLTILPYI